LPTATIIGKWPAGLRELARSTRSPGIRRELVDLAKRYDRRGEYFDRGFGSLP